VVTYVEVKVVIGAAGTGSVMVRFNGSPVLDISSVTTQVGASSNWTSFYLRQRGGAGGNAEWHLDDFYLADGFGDAPWNNLLGDCRCDCGVPTAEGALSDWAPLTGTNNADMVKEVVADGDTSYVSSVTAGHMDTYVVPNVAVPGSPPTGVQVSMFVRKEAAGLCDLAVVANLGGSPLAIHSKPVINPGTTYAFRTGIFQTNPATGLAWTEAEFNAAEFGFVRAS
jgi:hypothetical protein